MGLLTVGVPDGLVAGDEMSVVAPDGNTYTVMVPPGVEGGMSLEVDLPGAEEPGSSAAGMQQVGVVVPDGVGPGEAFSVEFDGVVMDIICPDDCSAGSAILVEMPAADNRSDPPTPEPPLPDESAHFKFKPGQRVELHRSGNASEEVTSSGNIVCGFEGVFDVCYKVKLDNGLFKEAVPEDEISAAVSSDMGDLFDGYG